MDLKNWRKITKGSPEDIENFHVIVGSKAIRIWEFRKSLNNPVLIETIYWKDVMGFDEETCR